MAAAAAANAPSSPSGACAAAPRNGPRNVPIRTVPPSVDIARARCVAGTATARYACRARLNPAPAMPTASTAARNSASRPGSATPAADGPEDTPAVVAQARPAPAVPSTAETTMVTRSPARAASAEAGPLATSEPSPTSSTTAAARAASRPRASAATASAGVMAPRPTA